MPRAVVMRPSPSFFLRYPTYTSTTFGPEHGRLRGPLIPEAQSNPGQQLLEPERLGHVVVGPGLEPPHGVGHAVPSGEDDHRRP
jgi:hypothetical protein